MSVQTERTECSLCGVDMELVDSGSEKSIPLIGSEVEFRRYRCPDCGQAVRFERSDPDEEWSQAGL